MIEIRKYSINDEEKIMAIITQEGKEWKSYRDPKYKAALLNSITYVAYENDDLCGYVRAVNDNDYYIFVFDLLVTPKHRGKNIGRLLMENLYQEYPNISDIFVTSDEDLYYKKQGYEAIGTIFKVTNRNK